MKTNELKEKLVQNGVESEKKAKSIITWHEALGFVAVVVVFNLLSMLLGINWGILTLICAIVGVILGKQYVEKNMNDVQKLQKTYILAKRLTLILILVLIVALAGYVIYLTKAGI